MFKPSTSSISTENILDSEVTGWSFDLETAQYIQDSAIRLVPLTGAIRPVDLAWPKVVWSQEDELPDFDGDIGLRWSINFNNQAVSSPQALEHDDNTNFMKVDVATGEYLTFRQWTGGALSAQRRWPDQVSNAAGWTVQVRVQVTAEPDGTPNSQGHYLLIDDGTYREIIRFHETGLTFDYNSALGTYGDFATEPKEVRIAGVGSDLYVLMSDGRGFYAPGGLTQASVSPELAFGMTGATHHVTSEWDYVNFYSGGPVVDQAAAAAVVYATVPQYAYTPAYAPKRFVETWTAARVESSGSLAGGTTTVAVQYRSSLVASWTTHSTTTITEIGWTEILLDNIPTVGDGSDELRFKIGQESATGEEEPPRIEQIVVVTDFSAGAIGMLPNWGHKDGDTSVSLRLMGPGEEINVGTKPLDNATLIEDSYQVGSVGASTSYDWVDEFPETPPFGYIMTGWTVLQPSLTGDVHVAEATLGILDGANVVSYVAHRTFAALTGDGVSFPSLGNLGLSFLLEVEAGSVAVAHGDTVHKFYAEDYHDARRVSISLTGTADISFTANDTSSQWVMADPGYFTPETGTVSNYTGTSNDTGSGVAADFDITVDSYTYGSLLVDATSWAVGLGAGGFPYVTIDDGSSSDILTGNVPVLIGETANLAFTYREWADHTGLQLLLDGNVIGEKITTVGAPTGSTGISILGDVPCLIENLRVYDRSVDAKEYCRANGFSPPVFQSEYAPPPDGTNKAIFHFYENGGAIADDSGFGHHGYVTTKNRLGLLRNRDLNAEYATCFWGTGQFKILHTPDFVINLPTTIYAEGCFYCGTIDGTLYSKWNSDGTVGLSIKILTTGYVQVIVNDGTTETELTSNDVLADGRRRTLSVGVDSVGVTIRIDELETFVLASIGALSAATEDATVGLGTYCYLRHLIVRDGSLSDETYAEWIDNGVSKWQPDDEVYVDGTALGQSSVSHFSSKVKYFLTPAHDAGYTSVYVDSGGIVLPANTPFKYTYGYSRSIPEDRIDAGVGITKSPFRVLTSVPDGGVNLSFVQGPDISVDANVALIDLSHRELENLATYHGGEFALTGAETGSSYYTYTGQVDTTEVFISNRSVMRRDWADPTPLFHRYLVGRGRHYVYEPSATTVADIQIIRNSIKILDGKGAPLSLKEYGWDIEVSKLDAYGNTLPDNIFSVELFTDTKYIPGTSVQIQYYAVDSIHNWQKIINFTEIVNTEPIFTESSSVGQEQYSLDLNVGGVFNINVGYTGA